jgi:hypothetical protein
MVTLYARLNAFNRISAVSQYAQSGSIELTNPAVIEQPYNYRFDNGQWIDDIQPSPYHTLDAQGNWYLNNEYLQNAKDMMWQQIKAHRDLRQLSGFKLGDNWFHSDDSSRIKYLGLMMMGANIPQNLMWKTMQNTFVPMTQTLAAQIFGTIASFDSNTFIKAEQHKAAMQQSIDPLNYDYSSGWPLIFGE